MIKMRKNPVGVVVLVLAAAVPALANLAPPTMGGAPGSAKVMSARMRVAPDSKVNEARLVIPREVLRQLRAEVGSDTQTAAAVANRLSVPPAQTAIAGLCLSLSLVFAGMWFVSSRRNGGKVTRAATALVLLTAAGMAATAAYANAGPPPVARSLTSRILIPEATTYGAYGDVKVEIVDTGNLIELRLPRPKDEKIGE